MRKILLIDDNEEILSVNESHLTRQGFHVTCTDTGIKALALLKDNKYDCIVLDILLPDLDGFTICKAARTITDTPILFLSCLEEADDKVKGLMAGGTGKRGFITGNERTGECFGGFSFAV